MNGTDHGNGFIGGTGLLPGPRPVRGTYRSNFFAAHGLLLPGLELRVDVDFIRPQHRVSGDMYYITVEEGTVFYTSFIVEELDIDDGEEEMIITGPISYFNYPDIAGDTIEVRIPRVEYSSPPPSASVNIYRDGRIRSSITCSKISGNFRKVNLEIDSFTGTGFPTGVNTNIEPYPEDLGRFEINIERAFNSAGIEMQVTEDEVFADPDGPDPGDDWSPTELHDLMEGHFEYFEEGPNWNLYGIVIPELTCIPGYICYGIMFDTSLALPWHTHFRQAAAIAWDALRDRERGTLYNTPEKKDRLVLQTFIHELGHAFNLVHPWSRIVPEPERSAPSESFMNYPWQFHRGEEAFWANFRWQFDDVELVWLRHADRNKIIFAGEDFEAGPGYYVWMGMEKTDSPFEFQLRAPEIIDLGLPVYIELKLKNVSDEKQKVKNLLQPEAGSVVFFIQKPDGDIVRYKPLVKQIIVPKEGQVLMPGKSLFESVRLNFSSGRFLFQEPGEYLVRAVFNVGENQLVASDFHRFRVAYPKDRAIEELAYLMFTPEVAKILYFGDTGRRPGLTQKLQEAINKYADSHPAHVRYLQEALGRNLDRKLKKVVEKDGKRKVVVRDPNYGAAVQFLEGAHKLLPDSKETVFDNISYNRLSWKLADIFEKLGQKEKAGEILKETLKYFETKGVIQPVIDAYKERISKLEEVEKPEFQF